MRKTLASEMCLWIRAGLLCLAVLFLLGAGTVRAEMAPDWDDPDYVKKMSRGVEVYSNGASGSASNPYTGVNYTHDSSFSDCTLRYGIDVSKWDGTVNWEKVKADGIEFAILRVGYSTLSDGTLTKDECYDTYIKNAKAADVKLGAYYFSQAVTTAEAKKEAEYALKILNGVELDYPVAIDYEPESQTSGRQYKAKLSRSKATSICETFCETIEAAGYDAMVYGNVDCLNTELDSSSLGKSYTIWAARYNTAVSDSKKKYSGPYSFWQYSDSGKVNGISSAVDMDFFYDDGQFGTKSGRQAVTEESGESERVDSSLGIVTGLTAAADSSKKITLSFHEVQEASGYEIVRSDSYNGTYTKAAEVTGTSWTDTGLTAGQEYFYKVRIWTDGEDGERTYGLYCPVAYTNTPYARTYKIQTTGKVNLRTQAGTGYTKLTSVPKGTSATLLATSKSTDGLDWYKVKVKVGGTSYTGYLSSRYAEISVNKVRSVARKTRTATTITLSWSARTGIDGYQIYRSNARDGSFKRVGKVAVGTETYKDTGLKRYCQYYYKVRAYAKVNGKTVYGSFSSLTALSTKSSGFSAKTTTAVNMRRYAGTSYRRLVSIPKGKKMKVSCRTRAKDGKWWYYGTVTVGGKKYSGYVRSSYLKKT